MQTRAVAAIALSIGLGLPVFSCSDPEADVGRDELRAVVARDAVAFEGSSLPAPVLDRLAEHQVVILGETHHLAEHWEFVATLLADLHARGFRQLLFGLRVSHLSAASPVDTFLGADYATAESQRVAVDKLLADLESDRAGLTSTWGEDAYVAIVQMVQVERASIDIRVDRTKDDDRAARAREVEIARLADARLEGYAFRTVINIGAHHAQKSPLMGTDQEWLGDYLVHRSTAVGGSVFVVGAVSARTELEPGASGAPFDILEEAPGHELLRVMAESFPGQTVFLPLADPLFASRTVAFYSDGKVYVATIAEQFDAVLEYGLAHRMPDH